MSTKMAVSHPWHFGSRGKLPKSEQTHLARRHICPCGQSSRVCRARPPIGRLLGKFYTCQQGCQEQPWTTHRLLSKFPTWQQGCQDIYGKDPKGWHSPLWRYNWGRLQTTAETAELHTRVLPHATLISHGISHQRLCPAGLRTTPALLPTWLWRSFLARGWQLPCPLCCLPDLQTEILGLRFIIPYWLLCVCRILLYVDVLLWVNLHSIKAEWTA